jgi:hypothetical protein
VLNEVEPPVRIFNTFFFKILARSQLFDAVQKGHTLIYTRSVYVPEDMTTPQQALDGARWICEMLPEVSEVIYSTDDEHWYVREGDSNEISAWFRSPVVHRSLESLKKRVHGSPKSAAPRTLIAGLSRHVLFKRKFCESANPIYWMSCAAWIVSQALDVEAVSPEMSGLRWGIRTGVGHCILSGTIEVRDVRSLRDYLNSALATLNSINPNDVWYNRYFLEDWLSVEKKATELKPPAPVEAKVEPVVPSSLPPDLQGMEQSKGLTSQERRQGHVNLILQEMMTKKNTPRY